MKTIKEMYENGKSKLVKAAIKAKCDLHHLIYEDKIGAAGEHGVIWFGAIIVSLIVIALIIAFFKEEIVAWLAKLKEKINSFWAFI